MSIDDDCSEFSVRCGTAARDFLLSFSSFAKRLEVGAESYDPRYLGTVGLALGAAALHERPWDSDLASMVLKLADHTNFYQNSHSFSDEDQRSVRERVIQLQSRIWEYVRQKGPRRNAERDQLCRAETKAHLAALQKKVRLVLDEPVLDFHIGEAIYALEHPPGQQGSAPDPTKFVGPTAAKSEATDAAVVSTDTAPIRGS